MDFQELKLLFTLIAIIVVIVALLFLQCVYFFKIKPYKEGLIFTVTRESIGEQSDKIKGILAEMHMDGKEMAASLLLLEEIVVRLQEHADQIVTAYVKKIFGKVSLALVASGSKYNPLLVPENESAESEDSFRDLIFKANTMNLTYKRSHRKNVVIVRVH